MIYIVNFLKKYFSSQETLEEKLKNQNQARKEQVIGSEDVISIEKKIFKSIKGLKYFFKNLWTQDEFNYLEFEEKLEEMLLECDFSAPLAIKISEDIVDDLKFSTLKDPEHIKKVLFNKLMAIYSEKEVEETKIYFSEIKTNIWLIYGSNGVGKTTTIAKIAHYFSKQGKKVLLVASDTYRAGAVEQLSIWAKKLKIEIVIPQRDKEDPSSLIYKALSKTEDYDLILCDTSGRQHNNKNLMQEIAKIHTVINKFDVTAPHESLVVIDSTIGQFSFLQAETFLQNAKTTGVILTKVDNSNRGGIIFSIKQKYNLPVKFIGTGETLEDFYKCDIEKLINKLVDLFFE